MLRAISSYVFIKQRLHPGLLDKMANGGAQAIEVFAARGHFDYTNRADVQELGQWFKSGQVEFHSMHSPIFTTNDFARAVDWVIEHEALKGPVNLASPNPLPNREFMRVFRKVCRRPIGLPAPTWMLGLGTSLLGTEKELILKSHRVVPGHLQATGFQFKFPKWPEALQNIVRGPAS